MISGKVWGKTWEIFDRNGVRCMGLCVVPGGFCSRHRHRYQWNHFSVLTGMLEVSVWKNDYKLCDVTTLLPGDSMVVAPDEFHQFRGGSPGQTLAVETYWGECSPSDIERESCGGRSDT